MHVFDHTHKMPARFCIQLSKWNVCTAWGQAIHVNGDVEIHLNLRLNTQGIRCEACKCKTVWYFLSMGDIIIFVLRCLWCIDGNVLLSRMASYWSEWTKSGVYNWPTTVQAKITCPCTGKTLLNLTMHVSKTCHSPSRNAMSEWLCFAKLNHKCHDNYVAWRNSCCSKNMEENQRKHNTRNFPYKMPQFACTEWLNYSTEAWLMLRYVQHALTSEY